MKTEAGAAGERFDQLLAAGDADCLHEWLGIEVTASQNEHVGPLVVERNYVMPGRCCSKCDRAEADTSFMRMGCDYMDRRGDLHRAD